MGITGSIIVYVMIWWIIFFSVLPIGIQSNKEVFKEKIEGMDPGAPKKSSNRKKFLITTLITTIIFGVIYYLVEIDLINLREFFAIMYLSKLFIPTSKDLPTEAKIKSHQLMLRTGMIKQSSSGIYSWLPLGFKIMKKIEQIVREEQNSIGAQEMLMPTIQSSEIWKESGRYDDYGEEMLRIKDRQGKEMLYGPTNEELITDIFRSSVKSYKSLPQLLYHIQWKFRDEIRPRFGVMRCKEFYMKDAYSFDLSDEEAKQSYNKMFYSYLKTFNRLDLKAIPMAADTGPIGGDLFHEFVILAETGESNIYADKKFSKLIQNYINITPHLLRKCERISAKFMQ